jgi:hypothetical protein
VTRPIEAYVIMTTSIGFHTLWGGGSWQVIEVEGVAGGVAGRRRCSLQRRRRQSSTCNREEEASACS